MSEQNLLKRKLKAKQGGNRRLLAEICNDIAVLYKESDRPRDALREYKEEARIYEELGYRMENAKSHRMMCEIYIDLDEFDKALNHGGIYLAVAQELGEKVEEQRALATLGRAYLLKGESKQNTEENSEAEKALKASEKIFVKSLVLCESLKGKISKHELVDMRARLLLNIGIVLEHLGNLDKAVQFLHKAQCICKSEDIFDVLHKCYLTEGLLFLQKRNDTSKALACFNKALDVAGRLSNKVDKEGETLALKAKALCKAADYQSAKIILLKAWKLRTTNDDEKKEIEKDLKLVAAMCYTEDLLLTTDINDHASLKRLSEKMGDGACHFNCYERAINFYLKMLEHAEKNGEFGKQLIPCYVSLSQTYKDMGVYEEALVYFRKEYSLNSDNPKEAFHSFLNIAECLYLGKYPYDDIEEACLLAQKEAQKIESNKLEVKAVKQLIFYQENFGFMKKVDELKENLKKIGYDADATTDEESESIGENTPSLGDDICIEDITDISDNEEENRNVEKTCTARRRGKAFTIKKNVKGETQLHQAAISGNRLLAERLIAQGHPVNVRDNAGWLPIHEACIHGNKDVVELLIQKGANVNDRGGTQCDGVTPIYDAACNGHLDVVELLLDSGATPIIKTDFGETALDALAKWKKETKLNMSEQIFFDSLCSRIRDCLVKSGVVGNEKSSPGTSGRSPVKAGLIDKNRKGSKASPQRTDHIIGRCRNNLDDFDTDDITLVQSNKRTNTFSNYDSSDNSSDSVEVSNTTKQSNEVNEYRNAIFALRNRRTVGSGNPQKATEPDKPKKMALLEPTEVGDDWLEDDVNLQSKKRKRGSDASDTAKIKRKSDSTDKCTNSKILESGRSRSLESIDLGEVSKTQRNWDYLFDSDNNSSSSDIPRENIDPSPTMFNIFGDLMQSTNKSQEKSRNKSRRRHQSTLIKAGFSRNRSDNPRNNRTLQNINVANSTEPNLISNTTEPDSTTAETNTNYSFNRIASFPDNVGSEHSRFRLSSSPNVRNQVNPYELQQTISTAPAAVKVRIHEKLLLVPISHDAVNRFQIRWLTEEVARRYYSIEGVKPTLNLSTADGALLSEEDPLSLVFSSSELVASVSNWNLPPIGERYIECCQQYKTEVDLELRNVLSASQATHILNLTDLSLTPAQMQPVLKATSHQANLTQLALANNCLGSEGMKHLTQCLPTMKALRSINLSGNSLNAEGMRLLLEMFVKSEKVILQTLEGLNFSFNPIGEVGFQSLLKITNFLRIKHINIESCDIGDSLLRQEDLYSASFTNLDSLNIANNHLGMNNFSLVLSSLNANVISYLNVCGIAIGDKMGHILSAFIDGAQNPKLRELNISRCLITDVSVSLLLRSLSSVSEFKRISLQYNPDLSVISLKKLIQHFPAIDEINLEGCNQIFKYSQISDFHTSWLSNDELGKVTSIYMTVNQTTSEEKDIVERFCNMWQCFWDRRAKISKFLCGGIKLTVID